LTGCAAGMHSLYFVPTHFFDEARWAFAAWAQRSSCNHALEALESVLAGHAVLGDQLLGIRKRGDCRNRQTSAQERSGPLPLSCHLSRRQSRPLCRTACRSPKVGHPGGTLVDSGDTTRYRHLCRNFVEVCRGLIALLPRVIELRTAQHRQLEHTV
jgi:hypothetical protein